MSLDGETTLACDCAGFVGPGGPLPAAGVTHVALGELTGKVLAEVCPSLVIVPLFSAGHDATSTIETLEELGYTGRIAVLAPRLPKPHLVERELRALGPATRLVLISL